MWLIKRRCLLSPRSLSQLKHVHVLSVCPTLIFAFCKCNEFVHFHHAFYIHSTFITWLCTYFLLFTLEYNYLVSQPSLKMIHWDFYIHFWQRIYNNYIFFVLDIKVAFLLFRGVGWFKLAYKNAKALLLIINSKTAWRGYPGNF